MRNKKWTALIIAFLVGLGLSFGISAYRGLFTVETTAGRYLCLCDGLTVTGLLFLCIGIMMAIAGQGTFDLLAYAVQKGLHHIIPGRANEDLGNYYDYKMMKSGRKPGNIRPMIIPGIILFAAGLVFMALWYKAQA